MAVLADVNYNRTLPSLPHWQEAAHAHNIEFSIHRVARGEEIAAAIDNAQASGATALNIVASPLSDVIGTSLWSAPPQRTCRRSIHFPKPPRKVALPVNGTVL